MASHASLTAAIFGAFLLGKPTGVFTFTFLSVRLGLAKRPPELPWRKIVAGGVLTGIGFTMALFVAEIAFDGTQLAAAKVGIMAASVGSAICGLVVLGCLTRGVKGVSS